jgi:hypothetical protein
MRSGVIFELGLRKFMGQSGMAVLIIVIALGIPSRVIFVSEFIQILALEAFGNGNS